MTPPPPDAETSERAKGRTADLVRFLLGKLRAHRPLTARLEYPQSVADGEGASRIMPAPHLDKLREESGSDPPDVTLAVGYVTGSSQHENLQEWRFHNAQLTFECRDSVLSRLGGAWASETVDEAEATATEVSEGWYDPTLSGGTDGLGWRPDIGRWQAVSSLRVEYWG